MAASSVLMIAPKNFISNPQTAGDNFFQRDVSGKTAEELQKKVLEEFIFLKTKLTEAGIDVKVFSQEDELQTPDAIFPNNWFSTFADGTFVLYPMLAKNRRAERRPEIISFLKKKYSKLIDLTHDEERNIFLEGTGSLVIDHKNKIAFASLSERTSTNLVFEWSKLTGYPVIAFTSYDENDKLIYHTNVMMCVTSDFAIVCFDAMSNEDEKQRVRTQLGKTHQLIEISLAQVHHFCGNCIELENVSGEKYFVMSDEAFKNFSAEQISSIEKYCRIIHTDLSLIEQYGGGGARCMLAELF